MNRSSFSSPCASEIPLQTEIYGSDVLAFCVMHKHVASPRGSMRQQNDHCSGEKVVQTTLSQTLQIKPASHHKDFASLEFIQSLI